MFVAELMPEPLSPVIMTTSGAVPSIVLGFRFVAISDAHQFSLERSVIQAQTKKERDQIDLLLCRNQFEQPSRLDQTKVSILTLVKHAETVCVRVAKDDELIIAA